MRILNICKVHPNAGYSSSDPEGPLTTKQQLPLVKRIPCAMTTVGRESDVTATEDNKSWGFLLGLDTSSTGELNC